MKKMINAVVRQSPVREIAFLLPVEGSANS